MKNRKRQRKNRKKKRQEEVLDRKSCTGVLDLTAFNAVNQIVKKEKAEIVLR